MIKNRQWVFTVAAKTSVNEVVCIVGSCAELGAWNPRQIVALQKVPSGGDDASSLTWESSVDSHEEAAADEETLWTITMELPPEQVEYRFCVAVQASDASLKEPVYAIRWWETHFIPRIIPANVLHDPAEETISQFGVSLGQFKLESGWLVYDSAVQLKLCLSKNHARPITFWRKKYKDSKVRVKVTPLELNTEGQLDDSTTDHGDSRAALKTSAWPLVEVAVLAEDTCTFTRQEQFGLVFNEEVFTTFQCRVINPNSIAYLFDYYLDGPLGEIPRHIGCSHLLPSNLNENFGVATIPITSAQHAPIGQLTGTRRAPIGQLT
ncbi:putative glycerophosphocholine phosphodiesterase GPCPD1 homolog 1, partial [Hyalella azteca]|uniref:Glycerophosphocholine phosphodiesterase GPCPD1 homolog 1 n=1 Tax=Hyalella azteca TaxID=294128 RepID=A0A8B7PCR8_HYAAZ